MLSLIYKKDFEDLSFQKDLDMYPTCMIKMLEAKAVTFNKS